MTEEETIDVDWNGFNPPPQELIEAAQRLASSTGDVPALIAAIMAGRKALSDLEFNTLLLAVMLFSVRIGFSTENDPFGVQGLDKKDVQ